MAVRIRMKQMGRAHRHYYRIVAIDARQPRDGKVIEELGTYDPMVKDKDNRVTLVPEVNQQNGSAPATYTFELFRGLLTWHVVSGQDWDSHRPWKQLS